MVMGVGQAGIVGLIYLAEVAPKSCRGLLVGVCIIWVYRCLDRSMFDSELKHRFHCFINPASYLPIVLCWLRCIGPYVQKQQHAIDSSRKQSADDGHYIALLLAMVRWKSKILCAPRAKTRSYPKSGPAVGPEPRRPHGGRRAASSPEWKSCEGNKMVYFRTVEITFQTKG